MALPLAKKPFRFFTRLSLTAAAGVRAADLRELLEGIKVVPDSVLYTHTHRFIQQFQFLVPEPANDFAGWAVSALQDELAGERLSAIDTVRYGTIGELRQALTAVLEDHLKARPVPRTAPPGEEFHFQRSIRFSLPTPYEARDLREFHDLLRKVSVASLYLHVFEARLRPPLGVNDFSLWFERDLGEDELADRVAHLDPYSHTHEALKDGILRMVADRLGELDRG
ncbi:MAG: hypothetical protein HY552_03795 [Elusimicrobia bacterium]|nr:hypothetical protein [Elusimicrobiota bacterium]